MRNFDWHAKQQIHLTVSKRQVNVAARRMNRVTSRFSYKSNAPFLHRVSSMFDVGAQGVLTRIPRHVKRGLDTVARTHAFQIVCAAMRREDALSADVSNCVCVWLFHSVPEAHGLLSRVAAGNACRVIEALA